MQYCSLQHWTLLLPPDMSSTECHFLFDPATSFFSGTVSNCLPLFYSSTLNTFKPGSSSSGVMSFCLFIVSMGLYRQNTGVGCHFLLQWTMFCQNSSLCPVFLGWSCMVWLHWVMQGALHLHKAVYQERDRSMDMNLSKLWETVDRGVWPAAVHEATKSQTLLSDWTTTNERWQVMMCSWVFVLSKW